MPRKPSSADYIEHGIRRKGTAFQVRVANLTDSARTLTEARKLRSKLEAERAASFGHSASRQKLGLYLKGWLELVEQTNKPGTYRAWEPVVRLRLLSHPIAKVPLADLTPELVQRWVLSLAHLQVKPRTQAKYFECLSAALNAAVQKRLIHRSPIVGVKRPKSEDYEPVIWSAAQQRTFLAAAEQHDSRYVKALRFVAYTGCRISEVCSALEANFDEAAGIVYFPKGKTAASRRTVPIPPEAVAMLREQLQLQRREAWYWDDAVRLGPQWLFRRKDGQALSSRTIEDALHRLARQLGLPDCRVHDLRHAYATAGLRRGVDRKVMGRLLGHANEAMTGFYQHVDNPMLHAAAEAVAESWRESFDSIVDLDLEAIEERNAGNPDVAVLVAEIRRSKNLIGRGMAETDESKRQTGRIGA